MTIEIACFLCLELTITAEISDTGASIAGHSYTLACNVTGVDKFSATLSYKWTKNNGTLTQVGSNTKTLSFLLSGYQILDSTLVMSLPAQMLYLICMLLTQAANPLKSMSMVCMHGYNSYVAVSSQS